MKKRPKQDGVVLVCPVCGKRHGDRVRLRIGDYRCQDCGAMLEQFISNGVALQVDMDQKRSPQDMQYIEEQFDRVLNTIREGAAKYGRDCNE